MQRVSEYTGEQEVRCWGGNGTTGSVLSFECLGVWCHEPLGTGAMTSTSFLFFPSSPLLCATASQEKPPSVGSTKS